MVKNFNIQLPPFKRGLHLVTELILQNTGQLPEEGLMNVFIQHTSAGLIINENADPSVRVDLNDFFNRLVKEKDPHYTHIFEGDDDMPAHIKSSLTGSSISVPIRNGKLALGIWQGIYLCEFRNNGGSRKLVITILS